MTDTDSYCGRCGRSLSAMAPPSTTDASAEGTRRRAPSQTSAPDQTLPLPPSPRMDYLRPALIASQPGSDSGPAAMISAIAALVIVAFAGAAAAIIIASSGGGIGPPTPAPAQTTITAITHEQ